MIMSYFDPRLSSVFLVSILSLGCESVNVFAEPERPSQAQPEELTSVGLCMTEEDCPTWACVKSACQDGVCVPKREGTVSIWMEESSSQESYISLTLEEGELIALVGEPSQDSRLSLSRGTGSTLHRWVTESLPMEEAITMNDPETWSPELIKIKVKPSLEVDGEPEEERVKLELRGVQLSDGEIFLGAGSQLQDLWRGDWNMASDQGQLYKLAAPVYHILKDQEEIWVSVFDKGLERLPLEMTEVEDDDTRSIETARFNTPGRALVARAGRSFVVVADGYAGLSLFEKRVGDALGTLQPARRLVTPPQELATQGRTQHIDLIEDRVISAELGAGVAFTRITPEGGLLRELVIELGGVVRWVSWIDPYTAMVWVEGRGLIALDLLTEDGLPIELANTWTEGLTAEQWVASEGRFALLNQTGKLFEGALTCLP